MSEAYTFKVNTRPSSQECAHHLRQMTREGTSIPARVPDILGHLPLSVSATDTQGSMVGGVYAYVHLDYIVIEAFWVARSHQGKGLGRELFEELIRFAGRTRCRDILASTVTLPEVMAAPLAFWHKLGFETVGVVQDCPRGGSIHYLRKRLAETIRSTSPSVNTADK